jgi:hypothetical protein
MANITYGPMTGHRNVDDDDFVIDPSIQPQDLLNGR